MINSYTAEKSLEFQRSSWLGMWGGKGLLYMNGLKQPCVLLKMADGCMVCNRTLVTIFHWLREVQYRLAANPPLELQLISFCGFDIIGWTAFYNLIKWKGQQQAQIILFIYICVFNQEIYLLRPRPHLKRGPGKQ